MMKKIIGIAAACLALMGCAQHSVEQTPMYLNTVMKSPVSGPNSVSEAASSLIKQPRIRHFILYPLRPMPGQHYRDDLDRKFAAAAMYIDLIPSKEGVTAEISGEVNYYDLERYVNARLVGDSIRIFPIPEKKVTLTAGKPVDIELPRGIHFSVELSDKPL
ncbi:hypothetical protein F6X50_21430 [Dickeya dianthicola]|uniref:hypothetical protein n=2 Tax=Dickeya dianthicola TaxID=204039 RepID=UPI00136B2B0B|nr:hypothetical protein [Dickeya dianthicola]MZI91580.1 hypothetical protein [Dickeya dianthicola]